MIFKSESVAKFSSLAESIRDNLAYTEGSIQESEKHKSYNENLPTVNDVKVTPEIIAAVSKYNGEFVTASHIAAQGVAADIFKKDKDVSVLEAKVGFFDKNDSISMTVHKKKTFDGVKKEGEEAKQYTKFLWTKTDVETNFTAGVSLKTVKDAIGEEFAGMFSK